MGYNPCGRAVDIGRRGYTTKARFTQNDPTETTIVWFPADPRAGTLPYPSKVCSLDWATLPEQQQGVGEVWNEPRVYNHKRLVPGLFSPSHLCGTEDDFRHGQAQVANPPVVYDISGLPTCCGINTLQFTLPFKFGISSRVSQGVPYPSTLPLRLAIHSSVHTTPPPPIQSTVPYRLAIASTHHFGPYDTTLPLRLAIASQVINATCDGAAEIVLNQFVQVYTYRRAGQGNVQWFQLTKLLPGSDVFCIATYPGADPNLTFQVYTGTCADLTEITITHTSPRCYDFVVPPDAPFWVVCHLGAVDHDDSYGFRVLGGTCTLNGFPP